MPFRIISGVLGLFFLLQGITWLIDPAGAAEALGMPLLEGIGRSTQIGDSSGFFLCLGAFALFGAYRMQSAWLRAAGSLVGIVAITRTIAWAAHDAAFPVPFVAVEVVAGSLLFLAASRMDVPADHSGSERTD